jgi:alkaline phosphatase
MQYETDRISSRPIVEPSLSQMVEKAVQILSKNKNGYFLMVEGISYIDLGNKKVGSF